MIAQCDAIAIAKVYSIQNKRLGWSDSDIIIKSKMISGDPCYVIYTSNIDLTQLDWLDTVTTTGFHVYVSMVTGKCIGYEIGNRGICFERG